MSSLSPWFKKSAKKNSPSHVGQGSTEVCFQDQKKCLVQKNTEFGYPPLGFNFVFEPFVYQQPETETSQDIHFLATKTKIRSFTNRQRTNRFHSGFLRVLEGPNLDLAVTKVDLRNNFVHNRNCSFTQSCQLLLFVPPQCRFVFSLRLKLLHSLVMLPTDVFA
jgi:hypothetical protein